MAMGGELMLANATARYSAVFPRGGGQGIFSVDCLQISGTGPSLAVVVETKNSSSTSWNTAGSFSAITATGVSTLTLTGVIEEQWRWKCTMSGTGGAWCCCVMNDPIWED